MGMGTIRYRRSVARPRTMPGKTSGSDANGSSSRAAATLAAQAEIQAVSAISAITTVAVPSPRTTVLRIASAKFG